MSLQQSRIPVLLYVPNILGYLRIIFAFIGLYYSIVRQPIVAIFLWILASVLDLFDGKLARLLKQTSQFGILLDIVADNVLRSIIYIATCNAASVAYYISTTATATTHVPPNLTVHNIASSQTSIIAITIISCFIICLEWITMLSTQLYTLHHAAGDATAHHTSRKAAESPHWKKVVTDTDGKKQNEQEWRIVKYYFSNNFCNPIGILGIYGLFSSNLFLYGCYYPIVYNHIAYYNVWMYLAFIGRLLSLIIELKFCDQFIQYMILKEDHK